MRKRYLGIIERLLIATSWFFLLYVTVVSASPISFSLPPQAIDHQPVYLDVGETLQWKKGAESFSLKLQMIQEGRALMVLNASGDLMRFSLSPEKTLNFDITGDKQADGSITLKNIQGNRGELLLTSTSNSVGQNVGVQREGWLSSLALVLIVLVILVVVLKRKKKRKRR